MKLELAGMFVFPTDGDGNPVASLSLEENQSVKKHRDAVEQYLEDLDAAIAKLGAKKLSTCGYGIKA